MEQHELPASLHTSPVLLDPSKSSHGCLPSPLQRGWNQRGFSQHGPNAGSSDHKGAVREGTQGHGVGPGWVGSAGPGDHILCYAFGRGTRQLLGCQRHLWWCQCCEPGPASRAWRAAAVSQREEGDFSSPRYLVHLDGSLGPLQCGGVGLLQPQGQRFLKPLMEVAQSQRSIPVEEGTCSPTTQQWHRTITPPALTPTPARDQPQNLW